MEKQDLLSAVKILYIGFAHNLHESDVATICRLLQRMTGLRDLHWPYNVIPPYNVFPPVLTDALEVCPAVRLHTQYIGDSYGHPNLAQTILYTFANNYNLYSLNIRMQYTSADTCLAVTRPLKDLLLTCPNIRKLELDIGLPSSGCVAYGEPEEYCGLAFMDGERPPALEELVVEDYPVNINDDSPYGEGKEYDYWAQHFDWSRLKKLKVGSIDLALALMPKLTALDSVAFGRMWSPEDEVSTFLREVPTSLSSITLDASSTYDLSDLLRHASTLRELQVHQEEYDLTPFAQGAMSLAALRRLRDDCPHLEQLEIDLARDGEWPVEAFEVLVSFPRLRQVKIWFALGPSNAPTEPKVTLNAVKELFELLRRPGSRVHQATLCSGAPSPIGLGYPAPVAFWGDNNAMSFKCTVAERDDERAVGRFYTSFYGSRVRDDRVVEVVDLPLSKRINRLALEGPMPFEEPDDDYLYN